MQACRFYFDPAHDLLVLQTPLPLSTSKRQAAARYALKVYSQRMRAMIPGSRRDAVARVVKKLLDMDFIEQPIPMYDQATDRIAF